MAVDSCSDPLLPPTHNNPMRHTANAAVDYRGLPASRAATGGWKAALFIITVEIAERFAFYGISANLISYLTGPLGGATASAAAAINAWNGVAQLLPLLGGALADSWLGRYCTIVIASMLYILGLGVLALSTLLSSSGKHQCGNGTGTGTGGKSCSPSSLQAASFYVSLYMVAIAQGGHKPCVQAFGADQFDPTDPKESVSRSSFFNWWYFGMCAGTTVTLVVLSYIQDNIGWGLGFGIPCIVMLFALAVFLLGTRTYRYYISGDKQSPFARASKGFAAWRRARKSSPLPSGSQESHQARETPDFNISVDEDEQIMNNESLVDAAKGALGLFPIWATCLIYAVVFAQSSTFFTKQAATLDRRIGAKFEVPPAALQSFISVTIVAFIPIYDRLIVPVARKYSHIPSGITMLQRIGAGMVLSLVSMSVAALVETKRLRAARDAGLTDQPKVPIPMSLWWMVPQYVLFGVADVFTMVGLQEFFYDQVPDKLRSLGLALYLSIFGVGSVISSILISVINKITTEKGQSWFNNNLNRAHLDHFYWLLAALSALELLAFLYFALTYAYKNRVAAGHATA